LALVKYAVFHPWKTVAVVVVGVLLGLGSFYAYQVGSALGAVATEEFDTLEARAAIEAAPGAVTESSPSEVFVFYDEPAYDIDAELARISAQMDEDDNPAGSFNLAAIGEPIDDATFDSYLLVGNDASGYLADTIILALQPTDGAAPIMVSLPRDLFVWNICKKAFTRLNTGLGGCAGVASGSELLAIMVEDYTGIPVDHLARVNFAGFARVVDAMGGIQVCIDHPRRDLKSHLDLESPGCQRVDGETALAWVRSRHPEELVGQQWKPIGGSDFGRQRRQQDVLFQLAAKASGFSSPASLTNKLSAVATSVRLDSSWSFGQAVGAAWRYRGISKDDVRRFSIDVSNYRTSYGAAVLLPSDPFRVQLASVYDFG
jgi:LCP family protein required for cell wall assembly